MPASRQRSRSPLSARAVKARMGRRPPRSRLLLPDRFGGLEAVHLGHLDVHQHQVERLLRSRRHGFQPVVGHGHRVAPFGQQSDRQLLIQQTVLGQQDAQRLTWFRGRPAAAAERAPAGRTSPEAAARIEPITWRSSDGLTGLISWAARPSRWARSASPWRPPEVSAMIGHAGPVGPLADPFAQHIAVHFGHVHVGQQQPNRTLPRLPPVEQRRAPRGRWPPTAAPCPSGGRFPR